MLLLPKVVKSLVSALSALVVKKLFAATACPILGPVIKDGRAELQLANMRHLGCR